MRRVGLGEASASRERRRRERRQGQERARPLWARAVRQAAAADHRFRHGGRGARVRALGVELPPPMADGPARGCADRSARRRSSTWRPAAQDLARRASAKRQGEGRRREADRLAAADPRGGHAGRDRCLLRSPRRELARPDRRRAYGLRRARRSGGPRRRQA